MDLETNREYYEHDSTCSEEAYTPLSPIGIKICRECSGAFDKDGHGLAVTDKRFDARYVERYLTEEAESDGD